MRIILNQAKRSPEAGSVYPEGHTREGAACRPDRGRRKDWPQPILLGPETEISALDRRARIPPRQRDDRRSGDFTTSARITCKLHSSSCVNARVSRVSDARRATDSGFDGLRFAMMVRIWATPMPWWLGISQHYPETMRPDPADHRQGRLGLTGGRGAPDADQQQDLLLRRHHGQHRSRLPKSWPILRSAAPMWLKRVSCRAPRRHALVLQLRECPSRHPATEKVRQGHRAGQAASARADGRRRDAGGHRRRIPS